LSHAAQVGKDEAATAYDWPMPRLNPRRHLRQGVVAGLSLALATIAAGVLQDGLGVPNPSAVYLVAVVATAFVAGSVGAVVVSVAAFLTYNFLFVEPRYTFTIAQPGELLAVLLLLFVGVVVGQLVALQRSRTELARDREREARALFRLSRALAARESTPFALAEIVSILREHTSMTRVWIALGSDTATERVAADSLDGAPPVRSGLQHILRRMPGDVPAQWVRIHQPATKARKRGAEAGPDHEAGAEVYRVRIEASGDSLGSVWATRGRKSGNPDRTETRLLAAAADQVGQALGNDRLVAERQAAEIARQSDAVKTALLQSVSHDLRTPLATIRAAAGSLRPGSGLSPEEQRESAEAIDREVEYLNRLVTNLLDLSRIEAGALRAERDVFELDDLVARSLERLRPRLGDRPLDAELTDDPVEVDPVFLDEALTNIVENAIKYTSPGTPIRISSGRVNDGRHAVRLTIEDAGPGVPDEALGRLFEKFYRVPEARRHSRAGTGIGLAVVRGLVEAMGGTVAARRGALGGLAIDIDLPAAQVPADLVPGR
jgi:two-component system sensor histidine kinase KdpD